jgi:FtsZ-binding cell division protein ZapB
VDNTTIRAIEMLKQEIQSISNQLGSCSKESKDCMACDSLMRRRTEFLSVISFLERQPREETNAHDSPGSINALTAEVARLNEKNDNQAATIRHLRQNKESLEFAAKELREVNADLHKRMNDMFSRNVALRKSNEDLNQRNAVLRDRLDGQCQKTRYTDLEVKYQQVCDRLERIKKAMCS